MIRNLERRREETRRKNFLHGRGGLRLVPNAADKVARAGGNGSKSQTDLRYDAEHSFRADKQPDQIEPGFVFVNASACPQDFAIRQHDFKTDHIIARHAVLQATRSACIRGDVSADACNPSCWPDRADKKISGRARPLSVQP